MSEMIPVALGVIFIAGFILLFLMIGKTVKKDSGYELERQKLLIDSLNKENSTLEERSRMLQEQNENLTRELNEKEILSIELNKQVSQKTAEYKGLTEKNDEREADLQKLQEKFRTEFKNLANEILEEKSKKFTELNKVKLDELLKPLGEKIRDFEKKVEETYDKESKQRFSLEKEIKGLAELNQQISQDAKNLTTALKMDTKKQGNWGELVLERVLESSGLVKG